MGHFRVVKAAATAALLLVPGLAKADPLFDGAMLSSDFRLFPFWQKVLTDMTGTASVPVTTPLQPAAFPAPAAGTPSALPAILTVGTATSDGCGDQRHCIPKSWTDFLTSAKPLEARAQLDAVNRWANAKPYVEDMTNWALPDYWETPGEFIAHGGDCEDYAIAKYFSLVRLGFSPRDLRIVIVSDSRAHDFHAVLVARLDGNDWLLDNQLPDVMPLAAEPQYAPVYSLNEQGWSLQSRPVIQVAANVAIIAAPLTPDVAAPVRLAAAN
jgi:predicted transglutaminase-like cysteine proteinase